MLLLLSLGLTSISYAVSDSQKNALSGYSSFDATKATSTSSRSYDSSSSIAKQKARAAAQTGPVANTTRPYRISLPKSATAQSGWMDSYNKRRYKNADKIIRGK